MEPAKVLIVDDHALFRRGVRSIIESEEDFQVVGEAEDGTEALALARELQPDLILMDIYMPHSNGLEAVSAIKKELPDVRIIMLSIDDRDENLFEAIKRGAEGFLSKNLRAGELLSSLRGVMRDEAAISRRMTGKVIREFARLEEIEAEKTAGQLTVREIEVLQKISEGLTNKEIALLLCISEKTVKAHVRSILRVLHLQSHSEAAAYALRWGLADACDESIAPAHATDRITKNIKELKDLERMEKYNKSTVLEDTIDGIVHNLRGGLGVIRSTAGFALDDVDRDDPLATDLRKIVQNAEFCELILRNLMPFGRGETFEPTRVNIERVFREVFFMLERKLVDVTLVVDADPDTSTIMADEGQMKQVFMNLIMNAGEAMPDGGTLTVRTRREGQMLRIEVGDTGCGISPENQERLFREFFTTKDRGYGLGLHIVHTIVKRHGGTIEVESKVGEGTTFTLHLPIESE